MIHYAYNWVVHLTCIFLSDNLPSSVIGWDFMLSWCSSFYFSFHKDRFYLYLIRHSCDYYTLHCEDVERSLAMGNLGRSQLLRQAFCPDRNVIYV